MIRFGHDEVVQLTQEIWYSMLKLPLRALDASELSRRTAVWPGIECLAACVQITGAWTGAVRIDCSDRFAKRTAAAFLRLPANEVAREEILDSLGEVTNMIAGSIKPLLPRPCHISLPSIVDGADYQLNIRKVQLLLISEFDCEGDQLKVSLLEATPPQ
jgi:chemotaxis protein CheX